jgi:hypothetical protein
MAELNEEGTHITGHGHWSAFLEGGTWLLWYGNHELWASLGMNRKVEKVKQLVDLLNYDDNRHDSILTSLLCKGFDVDGPLEPR